MTCSEIVSAPSEEKPFVKAPAKMNNTSYMKLRALVLILAGALAAPFLNAAENPLKPAPIKWCLAAKEGVAVHSKAGGSDKPLLKLMRGTLLPAYDTKKSGQTEWLHVVVVDPALLTPRSGWVNPADVEVVDGAEYPHDDKLLALSGAPFIEDFAAENTAVARVLLHTKIEGSVLVCYFGTVVLPHTRLQVFYKVNGRFRTGTSFDFPFSEMKSAITSLEARDLAGDGNEFLITQEPYQAGPMNLGVDLVLRRIVQHQLETIWKAPIAAKNLASYPPRLDILDPPEANIGRPGTDSKGVIVFRPRGPVTDIVWKGDVNFHALGREKPLESIPLERIWSWNGTQYKAAR